MRGFIVHTACTYGNAPPCRARNGLGTSGFILSLLGILTCGLLAPLALLVSLAGLLHRPRGLAVAGTVLSLFGSLWLLAISAAAMQTYALVKPAVEPFTDEFQQTQATLQAATSASQELLDYRRQHGDWPETAVGQAIVGRYADAFGRPLRYTRVSEAVLVISAGADGEFATADDLSLHPGQIGESGDIAAPQPRP